MDILEKTITSIPEPSKKIYQKALQRLSEQARPAGSLGILEDVAARLAAINGKLDVDLSSKVIVVCAGDHGVIDEGVSICPQEVTTQMVYNFVNEGASINVLAKHAGAKVVVADFGVNYDFEKEFPIIHKKIRKATSNLAIGPAMTRDEAISSVEAGIDIVNALDGEREIGILGTGDMGIGNTTPSTAIIAAFTGIAPEHLTGRGTGINDEGLERKIKIIKKSIALNKPDPADPLDVLGKLGGFEIGGLAGLVIGAAARGIPVICDGLISTAGALIACELAPQAKNYLFASHRSVEAGHRYVHERLDLTPILDLQFRLGEGTGAALAMELMDASTRVLTDIKTFAETSIYYEQF